MKKLKNLFFALLAGVLLFSCGDDEEETPTPAKSAKNRFLSFFIIINFCE
jgi:uncharacterized lipoprotein YbaY